MRLPKRISLPKKISRAKAPVPVAGEPATTAAEPTVAAVATKLKKKHFRRTRRAFAPMVWVLSKIPHPPWRSKRGIFVLAVMLGGFGMVVGVGGMTAISFSETPAFCGMCHTMDPELKAYAMSPHKDVTCAECHINPGLGGFIKAKSNGTIQLLHILTGKYPTPIEPPDHAKMPSVKDSCLKCHEKESLNANGGTTRLVLRTKYLPDQDNTKQTLAILIRPAGLGQGSTAPGVAGAPVESGVKGVHWHIEQKVSFTTSEVGAQKIDLVSIAQPDGTTEQYIAGQQVAVSTDVLPDIERLKSSETTKVMDCMDCHNRVGHGVPSPDRSVDDAISAGKISTALPFIKRNGVALLNGVYPTTQAANTAIDGLRATYAAKYPLVAAKQGAQISAAIAELKVQYELVATPAMKVQAKTYPDNLGHTTSLGCFRCHDGAHYLVVKGKIINKTIPSACATCHTFPQVGDNPAAAAPSSGASSFPLGVRPATHKDRLYVFNHRSVASSTNPAGTSCAACHTATYCSNCHKSGAIKVTHTNMLYNHAASVTAAGGTQACAYCHLPVYCQKCHKSPVLTGTTTSPGIDPKIVKPPAGRVHPVALKARTP